MGKDALAVTSDPAKLKAGVQAAWGVSAATIDAINVAAAAEPGSDIPAEALDFARIIEIIRMIIELLKNLGII